MMPRRDFLFSAGAAAVGTLASGNFRLLPARTPAKPATSADSVIFLYIGGGQPAPDTWDPKRYTPFKKGMPAKDLASTFPSIPTKVDGLRLSAGLEQIAQVIDRGTVIPSFVPGNLGVLFHVRHIYYLLTGYKLPQTTPIPCLGSVAARALGSRHPDVPAFVDIGQRMDLATLTTEVKDAHGPGFFGSRYGPFAIPNPAQAVMAVRPPTGMSQKRFSERYRRYRELVAEQSRDKTAVQRDELLEAMDAAHRLMSSPAASALNLEKEPRASFDRYNTGLFGQGCLLARRMVEAGSRFVLVNFEFDPFNNWDTHVDGHQRTANLKREIDAPISQLILDLEQRGLLDRTLVVIASEFSRSVLIEGAGGAAQAAEQEFEKTRGAKSEPPPTTIDDMKQYGLHRHFSGAGSVVMFGGGIRKGYRHGRTQDDPPFDVAEKPVSMSDFHSTIYHALGIAPDRAFEIEGRPFFVTPDGHGQPVLELFARQTAGGN